MTGKSEQVDEKIDVMEAAYTSSEVSRVDDDNE